MRAVVVRLQAEARDRWRAWWGLAVVAGLVGGATIAVLTGARRTETAYRRFLEGSRAFDVMVTNGGTTPDNVNRQFDFGQVARLPLVGEAALVDYYAPSGTAPSGRFIAASDITPLASVDGRFATGLNRARVLHGRFPRGQHEVAVTFLAADRLGLDVGRTVRLRLSGPQGTAATEPLRVVGVVAMQGGFPPLTGGLPPPVLLSTAYARAHPDAAQALAVRLRRGRADIATFERALDRLAGGEQVVTANQIELTSAVQRSLAVQATALRILAALVAAVALLLLGQALARQGFLDSEDHQVLRALGISRAQLRALGLARAVLIAAVAALVAAVTAVALSPLTPVGVARQAELHRGIEVNAVYVGAGAAAVLVVVSFLGALPAWWSARRAGWRGGLDRGLPSHSRLDSALARVSLPAPAASGVRLALERGGGRTAVPARSTIATAALGVATIAGVLSFSASLGRLFDQPRLYGWNWDVQVGDAFSPDLGPLAARLDHHPGVGAVAVGTVARLQIGGRLVDTLATEPVRGTIEPTVVEGRAPSRPGEILLGTRTLRNLSLHVGSPVTVRLGDRASRLRVVGRGVLTEFAGAARLGDGAALTLGGMRRILPGSGADVVLVRVRPGPEGRALVRGLVRDPPGNVYVPDKPSDLADLERVGGLPSVVAGLLAVMAVATLAHTLVTSVRRRRRDLAVLKMLGFTRGQVSAAVAWQSSVVAVVALVVGLPVGVAGGRWAWKLFADRLGVPPQPVTPVVAVALLVPATILLANVIAAVPARLAARTPSTAGLRAE